MTINTDITASDFMAFVRFVARKSSNGSGGILWRWLIALGIGAAIGVGFGVVGVNLHFPSLLVGALGCIVWFVSYSRIQMRKMTPSSAGFILGPRQVTLSDEGLREASRNHESLFRWPGVLSVHTSGQHVFILVDQTAGIIVPFKAFGSEIERGQFVGEIQRRIGKAGG